MGQVLIYVLYDPHEADSKGQFKSEVPDEPFSEGTGLPGVGVVHIGDLRLFVLIRKIRVNGEFQYCANQVAEGELKASANSDTVIPFSDEKLIRKKEAVVQFVQFPVFIKVGIQGVVAPDAKEVVQFVAGAEVVFAFGAQGEGDIVEDELLGGRPVELTVDGAEKIPVSDGAAFHVVTSLCKYREKVVFVSRFNEGNSVVFDEGVLLESVPVLNAQGGASFQSES